MVARLSALRAGRFLPQEDSWYSFLLEADSTPGRAIVPLEGLGKVKKKKTPHPGLEPETLQVVA
jgi:hypothetical protein